jgi:hypothetical protein
MNNILGSDILKEFLQQFSMASILYLLKLAFVYLLCAKKTISDGHIMSSTGLTHP